MGRKTFLALLAGGLAAIGVALVWSSRLEHAAAAEITDGIRRHLYQSIERADGQARLLASEDDTREGLVERNRIRLRGALRRALPQMQVNYAGILLADGTPFYSVPDRERDVPIISRRLPIEHQLRPVGALEYGVMLTDDWLGELGAQLGTDVRLARDDGGKVNAPPADVFAEINRDGANGRAFLRAPGDTTGPVLATLGFRVPAVSPAAARVRRERARLLALIAAVVLAVAGYDVRDRRKRAAPLPSFVPIPNPYIVGNPIRSSDMFFGREDDFQFAGQKLTCERAGTVIVFCGERRSGKTSILFQILNGRLGPAFLPILIDMQYFAAISRDQDFYESVVKEFVRAVYPEDQRAQQLQRFHAPSDSAAQSFETVLDEAMAAYPDKAFLFLFDEYEILEAKIERGELTRMMIPYLAGLLERKQRISFVFTGSRNLEERPGAHWRLMLGKSQYRKISYLTRADAERLVMLPVRGGVTYEPEAVDAIWRLTSGQPFYTQVICQNLIDYLNEVKRRTVRRDDVPAIVDAIVDNPLPQMIYFWDSLLADEKTALSLLAEDLNDDSSWSTAVRMIAGAKSRGVPVVITAPLLEAALEALFEKELLAKSPGREFQYRVDLLRHWIRRAHSIWQVLREAESLPNASA